jgi:hypothetical protein
MLQKIFGFQLLTAAQTARIDDEYKVFREFEQKHLMKNGEPAKRKISELKDLVGIQDLLRAIHRTSKVELERYPGNVDERISDLDYYTFMLTQTGEDLTHSDYNGENGAIRLPILDSVAGNVRFYDMFGRKETLVEQHA